MAKVKLFDKFRNRLFAVHMRGVVAEELVNRGLADNRQHAMSIAREMDDGEIADAADSAFEEFKASRDFTKSPLDLLAPRAVGGGIIDFIRDLDPDFKKALRDLILKLLGRLIV